MGGRLYDAWRDGYLFLDDSHVEPGLPDTAATRFFLWLLPFAVAFLAWKMLGQASGWRGIITALSALGFGFWFAAIIRPPDSHPSD